MKKLLLMTAIAVFGLSNVNAQDENTTGGFAEGDLFVSGTAGFSSNSFGDAESNSFNFSPSVGFFITENIALEANLLIGSSEDEAETKRSSFGGGISGTYFFTAANQFSFTVGAGVSYASNKTEFEGVDDEFTSDTFAIAVSPGVHYFVSDDFALRASIGALSYRSEKADFDGAEADNNFGLNLNLSDINFGIVYKF